jgi:abequosyltransferase
LVALDCAGGMTFLSICIPTYNRAEYLPATLDSVAREWADDLEITVADNASSDGTDAIVEDYRRRLGAVRYFRWETNQGADRNYLKAVELASGKYAWLLGSDDPIRPGAIATLRAALQKHSPTIVLFNRFLCTKDLHPLREDPFLDVGGAPEKTFDFHKPGALKEYLDAARSICSTFSYVSSTAFSKEAWDDATTDETFIGTAYVHVQKLLDVCRHGAVLHYINAPLVNCRLGNDAFRDLGLAKRVLLDLHGYDLLADRCFGPNDPATARSLRSVVLHEYPFGRILRYQGVLGRDPKWPEPPARESLVLDARCLQPLEPARARCPLGRAAAACAAHRLTNENHNVH